VKINSEVLLFDCGEGTQKQLIQSDLSFMDITKLFISHFHGDHILGLPGLIQSMQLNNREKPLYIYGPTGTKALINTIVTIGNFEPAFKILTADIENVTKLDFGNYVVVCSNLSHRTITYGYSIEEKERHGKFYPEKARALGIPPGPLYRKLQLGKSIVYKHKKICSREVIGVKRKGRKIVYANDTRPCENTINLAKYCDVLIHDATYDNDFESKSSEYGHSTAKQAALIAKQAIAKLLFLIHISPRYKNAEHLLKEACEIFPNSRLPKDLESYEVRYSE